MKKVFFLMFFISIVTYAQNSINIYKYVIVPKQFNFLKEADKYQTSSLTKFLFNKYGFIAFFDDEQYPADLRNNGCLALTAKVKEESSVFSTKIIIELRDCNNRIVFKSLEGKSKVKEYKKAYHEAIREAFNSVKAIKYSYKPIARVNERLETSVDTRRSNARISGAINTGNTVTEIKNTNRSRIPALQSKPIKEGYQLLNAKNEVAFTVLFTSIDELFVIKNSNGIFYKDKLGRWIAEFYDSNGIKVTKKYDLKMIR